ncbi:MAG: carbohydrate kinase family protein [bacterium]|nr:carbohydrate kinase family protein [bacterium]
MRPLTGQDSERTNYVIIADCAIDWIIRPNDKQYSILSSALLKEELQVHKDMNDKKAKAIIRTVQNLSISHKRHFGGPIFNISQYLQAARGQKVSVVSVIGTNKESEDYKNALENIGVDTRCLLRREGTMPVCLYVYKDSEHQLPRVWRGNVSGEPYLPQSPFYNEFLNSHDVLVLAVANPKTAVVSIKNFVNTIAYNPGPYLKFFPFEQTRFTEIIPKTHILSANKEETEVIKINLGLKQMTELFQRYEGLEYIITTLGKDGSEIHKKDGQSYRYDPKEDNKSINQKAIVDDVGAGDAYFATALHYIMRGMNVSDIVMAATRAAQQSLLHPSAVDIRLLKEDASPFPSIIKVGNGH